MQFDFHLHCKINGDWMSTVLSSITFKMHYVNISIEHSSSYNHRSECAHVKGGWQRRSLVALYEGETCLRGAYQRADFNAKGWLYRSVFGETLKQQVLLWATRIPFPTWSCYTWEHNAVYIEVGKIICREIFF